MKATNTKNSILALTAFAVLAGCATPPADTPPGALKVVYSQYYPDGSYLKEQPTEVRLVTRDATTKNVATQVGLNLLLLVYENLAGTDEATYRLKTDLVVYRKRGDGVSIKSLMAPRTVSCADQSAQAWPQSRWAEGNYLAVKQEMDALLAACETKVVAALDELLSD